MDIKKITELIDLGYITDATLLDSCKKNPELLKTININDYICHVGSVITDSQVIVEEVIAEEPEMEPEIKEEEVIAEEIAAEEPVVVKEEPVVVKPKSKK